MNLVKCAVPVCVLSMIVSLSCVGYMLWSSAAEDRANDAAEKALQKREKEMVTNLLPRFKSMYAGVELEHVDESWKPETIEELVAPLLIMMDEIH